MDQTKRLIEIMARLRAPGGCPWDREQTRESLRTYVLEEAFEVADAIDGGDWDDLREELGDLLLQVVFLAQLAEERALFGFEDVARGISDKLVRRHPHVFSDADASSPQEVWQRWDEIKQREKSGEAGRPRSRLAGLPRHLPSLVKAHRLAEKAARAGFDWPSPDEIVDKIGEEAAEIRAAMGSSDAAAVEEELGDLLFAAASLARRVDIDPERALARANRKFRARFEKVERLAHDAGTPLEDLDAASLDALWQRAKT